jgi:hypothetical protein
LLKGGKRKGSAYLFGKRPLHFDQKNGLAQQLCGLQIAVTLGIGKAEGAHKMWAQEITAQMFVEELVVSSGARFWRKNCRDGIG